MAQTYCEICNWTWKRKDCGTGICWHEDCSGEYHDR